jgi:peroxiredoxin
LKSWAIKGLLVIAVTATTFTACNTSTRSVKAAVKPEKDRKKAPDFALKDSDGKTVKLSDYKGKVVVLNFWATWCGPCKVEIPWFIEFEQKFKDRGFAVLGVSMDEDGWETVKPYIAARKINYRILLGDDPVSNLYGGVESLPTTFVIDRDGRVASVHIGLVPRTDYQNEIMHLLENGSDKAAAAGGTVRAVPAVLAGAGQ